ncbi:hypothetical protein Mgra_00007863 [Meloidogyne graminicola]|uniref:Uncharacterized protein n=1 Tax=Meloidogyne graminicola TaxID=189291 RepID=A0A8S9ZHB8_9BILA|nr:hypothetical protein Mgra_00007863 [Meloidogyne graminicola]
MKKEEKEEETQNNGPTKNWISFNKENGNDGENILLNSSKTSTSSLSTNKKPTALLEPIELNDIPLNDLTSSSSSSPKQNEQNKIKNNFENLSSLPPIPPPRPTTKPQKEQKKEIILEIGAGTSNGESLNNGDDLNEGNDTKNGKLLVTVYPNNAHCAWIIPPKYDYKIPSKLANNKQIEITPKTYEEIINSITKDLRFFSYAVIYSRLTPIWLIFSIIILLAVLASSPAVIGGGYPILVFTIVWLLMLLLGLLLCVFIRKYIVLSLRNLMGDINKITLLQYNILLGIQDRGQLSCHKVALMFIFMDINNCKEDIIKQLRINYGRFSTTQKVFTDAELFQKSENLLCFYSQEYAKAYMKKRFLLPVKPSEGVSEFRPKHCQRNLCLCQFIEREHFNKKSEKELAPWYEKLFAP